MSKFLNAVLGPLGIKKTGFERVGHSSSGSNQIEMDAYDTFRVAEEDTENSPEEKSFEFYCVTEFTEIEAFPAFDYSSDPQFFRRHEKLCYLVDKNVLSFAMKKVALHLRTYGLVNYGVAGDVKASEIDPDVLVSRSALPLADYPIALGGSVPDSALADIVTRDDSAFFDAMKKELRRRECFRTDWEAMGIYRIPSTVAAYVCLSGYPDFLQESNDKFTLDDIATYCIQEEKSARQLRREAALKQQHRSRSSRTRKMAPLDDSDGDSEEYADIRDRVYEQCKLDKIMRLGSHHRWYRVPYWALDFVASHTNEDDSASSSVSKKSKQKKPSRSLKRKEAPTTHHPIDIL